MTGYIVSIIIQKRLLMQVIILVVSKECKQSLLLTSSGLLLHGHPFSNSSRNSGENTV